MRHRLCTATANPQINLELALSLLRIRVACVWHTNGVCMAYLWRVHVLPMARTWYGYGIRMAYSWYAHNIRVECEWHAHVYDTHRTRNISSPRA